jgi:MFS family permease
VMPYLSTIGIARSTSSFVASGLTIFSVVGRLSFGWFGDKFDKRRVISAGYAMLALSLLLFAMVNDVGTWLLVPFLIFFGIGYGGPIPVFPAIIREYYGRSRLGTLFGLLTGVGAIGMTVGTPLAGWIYDTLGSYQVAWFSYAGVMLIGLISTATAPALGSIRSVNGKN